MGPQSPLILSLCLPYFTCTFSLCSRTLTSSYICPTLPKPGKLFTLHSQILQSSSLQSNQTSLSSVLVTSHNTNPLYHYAKIFSTSPGVKLRKNRGSERVRKHPLAHSLFLMEHICHCKRETSVL